jgi:hypothetical protein
MNTLPRVRHLPLLLALLIVTAAPVHPLRAQVVSQRETMKTTTANYKVHGRYTLNQLVSFDVREGLLNLGLNADLPNQVEPLRLDIEGSDATWVARRRTLAGAAAAANSYVTLTRYDFDAADDKPWLITMTIRSNYVSVSAQSGETPKIFRVRLTQTNGTLSFNLSTTEGGRTQNLLTAQAPTLKQLQAEHPEEVRKYLAPLLRTMTGRSILRPGPADVYRVFDTIPADPAIARKLDDLLVRLDADSYAVRDKASAELHALGAASTPAAATTATSPPKPATASTSSSPAAPPRRATTSPPPAPTAISCSTASTTKTPPSAPTPKPRSRNLWAVRSTSTLA